MMKRIFSLALCLVLCLSLLPAIPASAAGDVALNETNFPDSNVRGRLKYSYDTDGDDVLSADEIMAVTSLVFGPEGSEITSLKGIEFLTELESLSVSESKITEVDLSHNTKLTNLMVNGNPLTKLDVRSMPDLQFLLCWNTSIKTLDLSSNPKLKQLDGSDTGLKSLDIKMCPLLVECVRNSGSTRKIRPTPGMAAL